MPSAPASPRSVAAVASIDEQLATSSSKGSATLPPPAAIFAIPTHATTHASIAGADDLDADDADDDAGLAQSSHDTPRVYGRPAPSPQPSSYLLPQQALAGPGPGSASRLQLAEQSAAAYYAPQSHQALMPLPPAQWRTAQSILLPSAQYSGATSVLPSAWTGPPTFQPCEVDAANEQGNVSFADASPAATNPPPRYRRARLFQNRGANASRSPAGQDDARQSPEEGGGRFPRWREWLEKRAHEKGSGSGKGGSGGKRGLKDADVKRKKSWGAAVDGSDAISETDDADATNSEHHRLASPLHLHSFGSRFIPHLPALPLCAVSLELSPGGASTAARLLQRTIPERRKRRVLLIGTADGLYAAEFRRHHSTAQEALEIEIASQDPQRISAALAGSWNGGIRCVRIWAGIGVYQISLLATQVNIEPEPRHTLSSFGNWSAPQNDAGILLALCSSKKADAKHATAFSASAAASFALQEPGHGSNSHRDTVAPHLGTGSFGDAGGGGLGRVLPPGSSGGVRMWSLEAVRRMVSHVLDSANHEPLDLRQASKVAQRGAGKYELARRLRKAWAAIGDPLTSNSASSSSRSDLLRGKRRSKVPQSPTLPVMTRSVEGLTMHDGLPRDVPGRSQSEDVTSRPAAADPEDEPNSPVREASHDADHNEVLRLAQSWVPIMLPGSLPHAGQNESLSSLFSDESPASGGHGAVNLPSPGFTPSSTQGKGVQFYALAQGHADGSSPETWYLVLAQTKSLLLFESLKPATKGGPRSWNFLKELYTPLQPRGMSFCYAASADTDDERRVSLSQPPTLARHASFKKSNTASAIQTNVRPSPYSSVFREESSLHILVSFGKKAVLIRASDGQVRELEPPASSTLMASAPIEKDVPAPDFSGHVPKSSHGHSHAHAHSPSGTRRSVTSDALEGSQSSETWNALQVVRAEVNIRCVSHSTQGDNAPRLESTQEDDEEDWESDDGLAAPMRSFTLRDSTSGAFSRSALLQRHRPVQPPSHRVLASLAVVSRGRDSFIVPSPLPRDALTSKCLATLTWSAVPTVVSASARVVGLERGLSSGPIPLDALGRPRRRQSSMLDPSGDEGAVSPSPFREANKLSDSVILHIDVTLLAFLSSRIEMRQERVRLPAKLPFAYARDSELEIEPIRRPNARPAQASMPMRSSSLTSEARGANEAVDQSINLGIDDDAHSDDMAHAVQGEQELEYLCGMLHTVSQDEATLRPWEAGGDGGAWAFDWRGANDYRIFYVGVHV